MKQFTITYAAQAFFGQGFRTHTEKVWGAVAAHRVLKSIRAGRTRGLGQHLLLTQTGEITKA